MDPLIILLIVGAIIAAMLLAGRLPGRRDAEPADPIAEAEVYLAYGRRREAEQVLKTALKREPDRRDIANMLQTIRDAR